MSPDPLTLLQYDPDTGIISTRPGVCIPLSSYLQYRCRYNKHNGSKANAVDHLRYGFLGVQYHGHRLAMRLSGINIDGLVVHHINHVPTDNRLLNLRLLTPSQHMRCHQCIDKILGRGSYDPDHTTRPRRESKQLTLSLKPTCPGLCGSE